VFAVSIYLYNLNTTIVLDTTISSLEMKRQRADPSQTRGSKKVKSELQDDEDDIGNIPSTSSSKSAGPGKAKAGKSPKEVLKKYLK